MIQFSHCDFSYTQYLTGFSMSYKQYMRVGTGDFLRKRLDDNFPLTAAKDLWNSGVMHQMQTDFNPPSQSWINNKSVFFNWTDDYFETVVFRIISIQPYNASQSTVDKLQ